MNNELFSKRITESIKNKGITQKELADKSGLSAAAINQYIKGIYRPTEYNLEKIARILDVDAIWLRGYDPDTYFSTNEDYEKIKRIIKICDQLNPVGLEKLIEYGTDILEKYRRE